MIIATNKSDTMLKRTLGKGQTSTMTIEKILDQLSLDPKINDPIRDAYIITNEDISATRLKIKFEQSVAAKHPDSKIIFINKSSKPMYANGLHGLDVILQKPKPEEITGAITAVLASSTITESVEVKATSVEIPDYTVEAAEPMSGIMDIPEMEEPVKTGPIYAATPEEPEELPMPESTREPVQTTPEPTIPRETELVERFKAAQNIADVTAISKELVVSKMLKELVDANSTYAGIEEKLKSTKDMIHAIMTDPAIPNIEDRLTKVRALIHDKQVYNSTGDTIIWMEVAAIVETICKQCESSIDTRLGEIDTAIYKSIETTQSGCDTRLAGINEERASIIAELRVMVNELEVIYKNATGFVTDVASHVIVDNNDATGSDYTTQQLKIRGQAIISEESVKAIRNILSLNPTMLDDKFPQLKAKIDGMLATISKLFVLESERDEVQQHLIRMFRSNNIEDTVTAQSLLKKSMRVFMAEEDTGRTIVPYLWSKYQSRQNANVLCLDLTGQSKYSRYGIQYRKLDNYMVELNQEQFLLVVGEPENNAETAQRIVTTLLKSCDYYKVINVVLRPDQRELFETIAQDILCVNYITDTNPTRIERMRDIICETKKVNVGRRIILNKCNVAVAPILAKLGLEGEADFQLAVLNNIPAITDASICSYNPCNINQVSVAFEDVMRYAKS